jgi:Carboxypeptidase regulatory-like domain
MRIDLTYSRRLTVSLSPALLLTLVLAVAARAQDTVTGAFEGVVSDGQTGAPLKGATVEITNEQTGLTISLQSDNRGRFYQGLLLPGIYKVRVTLAGYQPREVRQHLKITYTGEVVPVPVALDPAPVTSPAPTPTPVAGRPAPTPLVAVEDTDTRAEMNRIDGTRRGSFGEEGLSTLPLRTHTSRSFDDLALLLPGIAPPPQTLGSVAGPGVGPGVGSAGQFSVNGLRSRANNFTVDGSDNNDEDIGVRRQGFVALVPQPIESIQEYQVITLLAPAQFGRNIGAQVNAVSKSGGNNTHGTVYGLFNSSQLNARRFFDTTFGNNTSPLQTATGQQVLLDGRPMLITNQSGGEDSYTHGQGGFVLGGPLKTDRMFFFVSAEGQLTNATEEESFAVPTVEQRGAFGSGATAIFRDPFGVRDPAGNQLQVFAYPTTSQGDAIFSLYPFPNNPGGVFGPNTFTQVLPASQRGKTFSGKFDTNFKVGERLQTVTARYNFTDDRADIPAVGGAIFSSLRARVRTQNFSFFVNSRVNSPAASNSVFNQVRLSYGRTRLNFEELRDSVFLRASDTLPKTPFLLNAPLYLNSTLPAILNPQGTQFGPNLGPVRYTTDQSAPRTEATLGTVGQINIAGFSPVGVDVFNFPQRRVNNTYQVADTLTLRARSHSFTFGVDTRRTELNSELPRNSRPLITFNGAPQVALIPPQTFAYTNQFIRPETFAAASAASGFSQTLATGGESAIGLRFYQLDFFGQDSWRMSEHFSLSLGMRYEYNTPPREMNRRIEKTFNDPALSLAPGLAFFIGGRTQIFQPDRNNFAPRLGIAFSPDLFGPDHTTVVRGGYGLFYDQILGAVVSQSRNVYPTFLTIDFAGGFANLRFVPGTGGGSACQLPNGCPYQFINPQLATIQGVPLVRPGTLNTLNTALTFSQIAGIVNLLGGDGVPALSRFGVTLPSQRLDMPMAHQYSFTWDQQLRRNFVVSAAYVGTQGRKLLRFTTPNLGRNPLLTPLAFSTVSSPEPMFFGLALPPGARITASGNIIGGRPQSTVGAVTQFETTASSRYDALQLQARGRFRQGLQYQVGYTLSKTTDDVSDVFDLAGAFALPQNSLRLEAETGPANFDARHRFSYNFIFDFPVGRRRLPGAVTNGLQIAGTGQFQTGQPFTVNSIFDVNLDGNLTDRLDNIEGLVVTGDRAQPLRLTTSNTSSLLAPIGQDGRIGRNTFRAGSILELDLAVIKSFTFSARQKLVLRADIFNFINRSNFGIPVRLVEAPGFGRATSTVTPGRRIQIGLKYSF